MLNYFDVIKAQSGVPVKDIWAMIWSKAHGALKNLFDLNRQRSNTFTLDTSYYIYGAGADRKETRPSDIQNFVMTDNSLTVKSTSGFGIGFIVEVKPNTTYTMSYDCDAEVPSNKTSLVCNTVSSAEVLGTFWAVYGNNRMTTFMTNADTKYVYFVFRVGSVEATYSNIMLVEGSN